MINRGRTCHSQIYELVNSTWNMEELPEQWKESITVPIYKKGDEIDCTNYRGVSHLSPKIQNSSQCPSDKLTPYGEEITGGHQCRFWCTRSTTYHILRICQILEKKQESNEREHQLFIDFTKAYDSVTSEVLHNIPIEFGIFMKPGRLRKMCLNESYNTVQVGKHMSDTFPTTTSMKQACTLSQLLFNYALDYTIRKVLVNQEGLKLNHTQ